MAILGPLLLIVVLIGISVAVIAVDKKSFALIFLGLVLIVVCAIYFDSLIPSEVSAKDEVIDVSTLNLDTMIYIDDGKVFKYKRNYYIKTNNDTIIKLDHAQADKVYNVD